MCMKGPVTIKTIAKELGLSVSAVSKALNDYSDINPETKARVAQKAGELGYSPNILARSLVKKTSNFVGVVIRDITTVYGEMFTALNNTARRNGINLILYDSGRDPEQERLCIQNLLDSMAMGIIIAPISSDVSNIRKMCKGRVPVVYMGGRVTDERENFVATDGDISTGIALNYLIGLGHRKIALISDWNGVNAGGGKVGAYRSKMQYLDLPELIYAEPGDNSDLVTLGYQQAKRAIESRQGITAMFAVKDMMAIGAMNAVKEAGLHVPDDISVIGSDGINASALPMVDLTTVSQPREEMAEEIIRILLRHAEDPSLPAEHYLVHPLLHERGSCRRI